MDLFLEVGTEIIGSLVGVAVIDMFWLNDAVDRFWLIVLGKPLIKGDLYKTFREEVAQN